MFSKEKQFYEILKKYGVKDYWCTSGFNPSDSQPGGTLIFRSELSSGLCIELEDMYNDIETDTIYVQVYFVDKSNKHILLKGKEYRVV